jgi:hypothetical protein
LQIRPWLRVFPYRCAPAPFFAPPPLCFCCAATRSNSFCAFTRQYLRASFPSQICPHRFFFGHLFTLIPPKCNFYLANMPLSVRRRLFVQRSSYTPPYIQFSLLGFFFAWFRSLWYDSNMPQISSYDSALSN